jgi:hypothetical protein
LLDLSTFAVEVVVRSVIFFYTFSLLPSFSMRKLVGSVSSYWANHIDPKEDTKNAQWITVSVPTAVIKPHRWD